MTRFVSSTLIFLALYAQAASADPSGFLMVSNQLQMNQAQIQSVQPTWALAGERGQLQVVSFASINTIKEFNQQNIRQTSSIGFGLYQQHTPWMYSQLVVQQNPLAPSKTQSLMGLYLGF